MTKYTCEHSGVTFDTKDDRWIKVSKKSMSPYLQDVLAIIEEKDGIFKMVIAYQQDNRWFVRYSFYSEIELNVPIKVTHWMPLPELPKENKNDSVD